MKRRNFFSGLFGIPLFAWAVKGQTPTEAPPEPLEFYSTEKKLPPSVMKKRNKAYVRIMLEDGRDFETKFDFDLMEVKCSYPGGNFETSNFKKMGQEFLISFKTKSDGYGVVFHPSKP